MIYSRRHYTGAIILLGGFFYLMGPLGLTVQLATGDTIDAIGIPWDEGTITTKVLNTFSAWGILTFLSVMLYWAYAEIIVPWSQGTLMTKKQKRLEAAKALLSKMNVKGVPEYALLLPHTKDCYQRPSEHYQLKEFDGCACSCHDQESDRYISRE